MKSSDITATASVVINAGRQEVWDALTNPEMISKYLFGAHTETDWQPGSPITFSGEWQGKKYSDKGTILAVEPGKLIRYTYWSPLSGIEDKPENYMIVTYHLMEEDDNIRLKLKQENIPDEKTKEHSAANWEKVLADMKKLVEHQPV
jgi:uncharacterized protein YndB with AHSA1/START domain